MRPPARPPLEGSTAAADHTSGRTWASSSATGDARDGVQDDGHAAAPPRPATGRRASACRRRRRPAAPAWSRRAGGAATRHREVEPSPAIARSPHGPLARGTPPPARPGVPSTTTRPASKTSTRSKSVTRSRWCVTRTTCWGSPATTSATRRALRQVEQRGRLVHDQHRRPGHQHRGQCEQLLLPPGEQVRRVVGVPGEPVGGQRALDPFRDVLPVQAPAAQPEGDVLGDSGHHDLRVGVGEAEPTRRRTSCPCDPVSRPSTRTRPSVGTHQPVEQPREGGLARAVGPDHPDAPLGQRPGPPRGSTSRRVVPAPNACADARRARSAACARPPSRPLGRRRRRSPASPSGRASRTSSREEPHESTAPLAPHGWPSASAPPCGHTRASSAPARRSRRAPARRRPR